MRKLKLLFAAAALLVCAGLQAQKDVTSQYITNATLSDGTNGWTKTFTKNQQTTDPADAFSNSVQGNNTVGYASEAYAGWNDLIQTEYSMKQTITLPKGNYRLVNYSFFRQGEAYNTNNTKSLAKLVAGENKVALKTLGSINAAGYANSQAEGANCFDSKMYRNVVEFNIASDNTQIVIGIEGTFDEARSWCIVGMFELFDLDDLASVSSPTDVTYAITNPGFEYRDLTGWTNTGLKYQNNNWGNKSGIGFAEQWVGNTGLGSEKSLMQTLQDMPAGLYELSVYAHNIEQHHSDAPGTGMYLVANSDQTSITSYDQYKVRTTLQTDGNLTIGINLENCTGNWIAFDRFELLFYGDPLAAYQDLLNAAVNAAQALVDGNTIPAAAKTALQAVIDANDNDDNAFTQESEFNNAVSAIEEALANYKALEAPYAAYNSLKPAIQALYDVEDYEELETNAHTTLGNALSTAATDVEAATTVETIDNVTSTLKTAGVTYAGNANPTDDAQFDLTFMLTNPDLTGLPTWAPADGWDGENTGNSQVMQSNDVQASDGRNYFYEFWSNEPYDNGNFNLYLTVNLPEGTYNMECLAFAQCAANSSTAGQTPATNGISFSANDTDGSYITSTVLDEASLTFVNTTTQDVKIGLKAQSGNNRTWMGIGYVKLYKVPAQSFEISEESAYDTTQEGAGDVTLTRTIKADNTWNTIWLPFSMTAAELQATFGDDVEIAQFSEIPNQNTPGQSTINFDTMNTPAISPNVPVLLKTSTPGTSYTIEGRTIVAGTPIVSGTNFDFVGTTVANTDIDSGDYFISNNQLFTSTGKSKVKGTRAYLKTTTAGARIISFNLDGGETTAIEDIERGTITTGNVYNLNGQQLKKAQKGIFIQNGKKVVIK